MLVAYFWWVCQVKLVFFSNIASSKLSKESLTVQQILAKWRHLQQKPTSHNILYLIERWRSSLAK